VRKNVSREVSWLMLCASALVSTPVWADDTSVQPARPTQPDDSGFTVLSNATNVTHWGLGAGVGYEQAPYDRYGSKFSPFPLFFFDDKWIHAIGTTLDIKVGTWRNVSFTLRGQYALGDGYKGSDASSLNGMENRSAAFWYGPAVAWTTSFGTLTGDVLEGGNKGQKASIDFGKSFTYGRIGIKPHVGAEWFSSNYVDYYYGVRASEVRAGRPAYSGTSTVEESAGVRVDYHFTRQQSVSLDMGAAHLGSGITDSPIVSKRFIPQARFGYLYQFN